LKETFVEFWNNDILPVVNENDLVSNIELKFSDNDELATLMAIGLDADRLIICTSAGGFLDPEKKLIPVVDRIDSKILSYVSAEKSAMGVGGMLSKLTFTRLATSLGITVIICGVSGDNAFSLALSGKKGTTFKPQKSNLKARQKWLASGSITFGGIQVDNGAERALHNRNSLLTVGIADVQGSFSAGEVVQLINEEQNIIGVAKVKLSAMDIAAQISKKNIIAAHADNIVIF
jgi:glutamate 5-kinase